MKKILFLAVAFLSSSLYAEDLFRTSVYELRKDATLIADHKRVSIDRIHYRAVPPEGDQECCLSIDKDLLAQLDLSEVEFLEADFLNFETFLIFIKQVLQGWESHKPELHLTVEQPLTAEEFNAVAELEALPLKSLSIYVSSFFDIGSIEAAFGQMVRTGSTSGHMYLYCKDYRVSTSNNVEIINLEELSVGAKPGWMSFPKSVSHQRFVEIKKLFTRGYSIEERLPVLDILMGYQQTTVAHVVELCLKHRFGPYNERTIRMLCEMSKAVREKALDLYGKVTGHYERGFMPAFLGACMAFPLEKLDEIAEDIEAFLHGCTYQKGGGSYLRGFGYKEAVKAIRRFDLIDEDDRIHVLKCAKNLASKYSFRDVRYLVDDLASIPADKRLAATQKIFPRLAHIGDYNNVEARGIVAMHAVLHDLEWDKQVELVDKTFKMVGSHSDYALLKALALFIKKQEEDCRDKVFERLTYYFEKYIKFDDDRTKFIEALLKLEPHAAFETLTQSVDVATKKVDYLALGSNRHYLPVEKRVEKMIRERIWVYEAD